MQPINTRIGENLYRKWQKKRYVKDWVLPSGQELMSGGFKGTIWSEVCSKRLQKQVCSG